MIGETQQGDVKNISTNRIISALAYHHTYSFFMMMGEPKAKPTTKRGTKQFKLTFKGLPKS